MITIHNASHQPACLPAPTLHGPLPCQPRPGPAHHSIGGKVRWAGQPPPPQAAAQEERVCVCVCRQDCSQVVRVHAKQKFSLTHPALHLVLYAKQAELL